MRLQNIVAGILFAVILVCYAGMHLLNLFPGNVTLWAFNITFAREVRPVVELFDVFMEENSRLILAAFVGLIGLCWLAWHQRSAIITSLTTHTALFLVLYANIASHGQKVQTEIATSSGILPAFTLVSEALSAVDMAMVAAAAVLLLSCLCNHVGLIKSMILPKT